MTPDEALEIIEARGISRAEAEEALNEALTKSGLSIDEIATEGPDTEVPSFQVPSFEWLRERYGGKGMRAAGILLHHHYAS